MLFLLCPCYAKFLPPWVIILSLLFKHIWKCSKRCTVSLAITQIPKEVLKKRGFSTFPVWKAPLQQSRSWFALIRNKIRHSLSRISLVMFSWQNIRHFFSDDFHGLLSASSSVVDAEISLSFPPSGEEISWKKKRIKILLLLYHQSIHSSLFVILLCQIFPRLLQEARDGETTVVRSSCNIEAHFLVILTKTRSCIPPKFCSPFFLGKLRGVEGEKLEKKRALFSYPEKRRHEREAFLFPWLNPRQTMQ